MKEMLMYDKYNNTYRIVFDIEDIIKKVEDIINSDYGKATDKIIDWYYELCKINNDGYKE